MAVVELAHLTPLAQGSRRLVFQHPENDGLIIKVMKPGSLGPDGQPRRRRRYKLRRREGGHIYHRRELAEYLAVRVRSEEHTSELQSLMRISYAVFCLKTTTPPHL